MKKVLSFLLIAGLSLVGFSASAGPRVIGGGGDVFALQFVAVADQVLAYLEENPNKEISLPDLKKAIESTVVESTAKALYLNGKPKDAINYPEQGQIIFNRKRWAEISPSEKPALVLHEYLGILKIENASYKYSKALLNGFALSSAVIHGSDSAWLLCADQGLIVNIYEHRAGADTRETNITLIFGGYTMLGELVDVYEGPVLLSSTENKESNFIGHVGIDFGSERLSIKGTLNLNGHVMTLDKNLKCEEKSGR